MTGAVQRKWLRQASRLAARGHHEEAEAPEETTPPVAAAPADTPVAAPAPADPAGGDEATPGEADATPEK